MANYTMANACSFSKSFWCKSFFKEYHEYKNKQNHFILNNKAYISWTFDAELAWLLQIVSKQRNMMCDILMQKYTFFAYIWLLSIICIAMYIMYIIIGV